MTVVVLKVIATMLKTVLKEHGDRANEGGSHTRDGEACAVDGGGGVNDEKWLSISRVARSKSYLCRDAMQCAQRPVTTVLHLH